MAKVTHGDGEMPIVAALPVVRARLPGLIGGDLELKHLAIPGSEGFRETEFELHPAVTKKGEGRERHAVEGKGDLDFARAEVGQMGGEIEPDCLQLFGAKSDAASRFQPAGDRRQIVGLVPAVVENRVGRTSETNLAFALGAIEIEQGAAIAMLVVEGTERNIGRSEQQVEPAPRQAHMEVRNFSEDVTHRHVEGAPFVEGKTAEIFQKIVFERQAVAIRLL